MNTSNVKQLCSEERWISQQRSFNQGYTDLLLVRVLEHVPPEDMDAVCAFLTSNTSAKNTNASVSVTDPMVDNRVHSGTWHGGPIDVVTDPATKRQRIVQYLFRGSLTITNQLVQSGADGTVERTFYYDVIDKPTCPTFSTPGVVYRMGDLNVDPRKGTYTTWIDKRTTTDLLASGPFGPAGATASDVHEETDDNILDVERHSASSTALPDEAFTTQGTIIRTENARNEDGTFKTARTSNVSKVHEIAEYDSRQDASVQGLEKIGQNLRDADLTNYAITETAGETQTVQKANNPDGTFNVTRRREIAKDQTATDSGVSDRHIDADDRTVDVERHTAVVSALADEAFSTQGTIVETQSTPRPDGLFTTERTETVSKKQEIAEHDIRQDAAAQGKEKSGRNLRDADLTNYAIAETAGETQRVEKSENPDGTFNVTKRREIAKKQDTGWLAVTDANGTTEVRVFRNVTSGELSAISTDIDGDYIGRISPQVNEFGLYDGSAWRTGKVTVIGGTDWDNFTKSFAVYTRQVAMIYDAPARRQKRKYRDVKLSITVKQTQDAETAYAHIDNGKDGSRVEHAGGNKYRAFKITAIDQSDTWHNDEGS